MIDNQKVGRRIAALRQQSGLTQLQLAAMMNVSHQAVSKWEGGQAMPDIQTLLRLTRFFGLTVEQLVAPEDEEEEPESNEAAEDIEPQEEERTEEAVRMEANQMNIQQLLQMAPYMTKEVVDEIALGIEEKLTAGQIARLAPYLSQECVETLIEKHHPEFSWESLRRLAPHMRREKVDELARAIASGQETVISPEESFNRTMSDIGKAFDDLGRGMDKAVRKAIRFGGSVLNEVTSAINELSQEAAAQSGERSRSERAQALRRRAFERALEDGNWDWLGQHIDELDEDDELRKRIAQRARELDMGDWISEHLGDCADDDAVKDAVRDGKWDWLTEHADEMSEEMLRFVAYEAVAAGQWDWLDSCADSLELGDSGVDFAEACRQQGAREFAARITEDHLNPAEADEFARKCFRAKDHEMLELILDQVSEECIGEILEELAQAGEWENVERYVSDAASETVEKLLEYAVDQGNFAAVDMLDPYL